MKTKLMAVWMGITVLQATAIVPIRRAEAIMGIVSGNVPAIVLGSLTAAAGLAWLPFAISMHRFDQVTGPPVDGASGTAILGANIFLLVAGVVLLNEGENGSAMRFMPIDRPTQRRLGISPEEYEVYDSQLEEIATAWDSAAADAVRAGVQTPAQAEAFFEREYATLEQETRSVMAKLVRGN